METVSNRYRIVEQIGEGGMGAVYRALDRLTGGTVALKRVNVPATALTFASQSPASDTQEALLSLALEFRTLAGLRHPHIVSVLDYGIDAERQPYFTMQLIEGAKTLTDYAASLDTPEKIRLLVAVLQALSYLHRRGIIHRDLKPANVLVTADGRVKVMDFGLALHQAQDIPASTELAGTITYMAPELFTGAPASVASDLYAVGVMIYEMFAGIHPFQSDSISTLINRVLTESADTSLLDFDLGLVLDRLLSKDPDSRYPDADSTIIALCQAAEQTIPREDAVLRESFLQAAQFVGRSTEFQHLQSALEKTTHNVGSAWLIGGESGVGKSRLLDELCTRVLVEGGLVLRGQAVEGGGLPFQLWRDPLRRLVLNTDLSDLEAGVLKAVVPDIDDLLERAIPDAPELVGTPGRQRLVLTIAEIITRCAQSAHYPLVLVLEDLQWTSESLEPLQQIATAYHQIPLLIIGSYRDDERPDLPTVLPEMTVMKLLRLSPTAISDLSAAMLGESGRSSAVVDFLKRETEGNAYFMVEVVRALAEEAGQLSAIGSMKLPQRILAGGVEQVVRRRLERLPEIMRNLLKHAAVAGREIDLKLMGSFASPFSLDLWLTACANTAILEVADGAWRFAHDKLREAVLTEWVGDQRPVLHRQVAENLEAVYGSDEAHADVLLDHWHQAGDAAKDIFYTQIVANRLIDTLADYHRAVSLLEQALLIVNQLPNADLQNMNLLKLLGDAHDRLSDYSAARNAYHHSLTLAEKLNDQVGQAAALRGLSQVALRQGEYAQAVELAEAAITVYRALGDQRGLAASISNLGILARIRGDYPTALDYYTQSLTLRQSVGDQSGIAVSFNNLGNLAYLRGDHQAARDYHSQSLAIKQTLKDSWGEAFSLHNLSNIAYEQGDYAAAQNFSHQSLTIRRTIHDRQGMGAALGNLGNIASAQGDYPAAQDYYNQSLAVREEINDRLGIAEALLGRGMVRICLKDTAGAFADLKTCLEISQTMRAAAVSLEALVGMAHLHLLAGDTLGAAELVGLVASHPATAPDTKTLHLNPLLAQLPLHFPDVQAALERGRSLELAAVIAAPVNPFEAKSH